MIRTSAARGRRAPAACAARQCMLGCRYGAKNTLVKNYLWFAEKLGVEVLAERQVTDIRPIGPADGSEGYEVETEHPGAWLRKRRRKLTARGVVVAAGRAGHEPAARELQAQGRPAADLRPARRARPHEQRVDPGDHRGARRRARLHEVGRDHLEHLPRPRHPHRGRRLRGGRRRDQPPVHDDDRRRDAADEAAEVDRRRWSAIR